jgi:hypothetical protein
MFATRHENTITIAHKFVEAFTGIAKGYKVQLHALPGVTFKVEAASVDEAQALTVALCKREGQYLASTGATVQRIAS